MDGRAVIRYLKELERQLEEGFDLDRLRRMAAAAAIPTAMLVAGCDGPPGPVMLYGVPEYGAPMEEYDCTDNFDDDGDGLVDCDDGDCTHLELCLGCHDGLDNDGDAAADCSDPSCSATEGCVGSCENGEDDDGNGLVDCDDPSCAGSEACP